MRSVEPWVAAPLAEFLRESSADLVLLMTSSGQVVAQHGFARSLDVMAAASLGAAIVASTGELARVMGVQAFGHVVHQGRSRSVLLAPFAMPRGTWIGLIVFDRETTVGLVQLFFRELGRALSVAAPATPPSRVVLAEQFEEELNASLRTLFGR